MPLGLLGVIEFVSLFFGARINVPGDNYFGPDLNAGFPSPFTTFSHPDGGSEKYFVTASNFSGTCFWNIVRAAEPMNTRELVTDAELVTACLAGDREAFACVVERYQRLLCSLAYSATGSLSASEDLAQEAFLDAWRQLSD